MVKYVSKSKHLYSIVYTQYIMICKGCGIECERKPWPRGLPQKFCTAECRIKTYNKSRIGHWGKYKHSNRKGSIKRRFGLTVEQYESITKKCHLCVFDRFVHLHHINGKNDNENLMPLCPNHHELLHRGLLNEYELVEVNKYGMQTM